MKTDPKQFDITASDISIEASSAKPKGPRRFEMIAYTGGAMDIEGFAYPVIVDLAGLGGLDRKRPALLNHDSAQLVGHIEHADAQDGRTLSAEGFISGAGVAAQEVLAAHDSGFPWSVSIGAKVKQRELVPAGKSVTVNKQTFQGPVIVARKSMLGECSFVPLGADDSTSARIAATNKGKHMAKRTQQTAEVIDTGETDEGNAEDIAASVNASIVKLIGKYPGLKAEAIQEIQASAIKESWNDTAVELAMLRASRPPVSRRLTARSGYGGSGIRGIEGDGSNKHILAASLMIHGGRSALAEKTYGGQIAQMAEELRCNSLVDICATALRLDMRDVPRDRNEMLRAAFSTASLPVALSAYSEKSAAEAFNETPSVWRAIARRRNVNTFHEHKISRVLLVGNLQPLAPGGEIEHGRRSEDVKSVAASTKALMLGIDRTHVVNDNLQTFNDTSVALGMSAARTMNDDFANTILANAGSFFSSGNGNYLDGATPGVDTDSRMNVDGLNRAIQSMQKRTDSEGRIVDVRASTLLVPPELEFVADQLINSAQVWRDGTADQQAMGNPFQNRLTRLTEPRLSSSAYSGYSISAWYLFASPQAGAVNVALLNGKDTPTIEQSDAPFDTLGLFFRAYQDYGFELGEEIAATKMKGAAA